MADRYFVDEPISPGHVTLAGPEAHHLIHVMRAAPGMAVVLFDGSGAEFPATVERVGRNEVELLAGERHPVDRELPMDVTLAVALPKGDRQRWLIEKAVELGVTRIVPLHTQRGVAQPVEQAIARLRRAVVEASKQCGRNRLMSIESPRDWTELIETTADAPCRLLAQPEGFHRGPHLPLPDQRPERVWLAIGPEGGLTGQEVSAAVLVGWHTVDLGPRILRVETAALMLAAMVVSFPYAAP
ncbi:MAG: 16S rRNA (uracil(1498)-N(3))-methyltransferase [Planctomycetaceae bacterium]|nr:16S rRNA (uracil(1498)-N(3))-methyltransferase [Planctomycetaceae bacterium]